MGLDVASRNMRLNTPQEVPATSGLMVDIVSRHLDFSSEERIRRSQYLRKRFQFGKVVHVSPHTSGASHILDHRESLFRPAKRLAMLRKMPPVTISRERSSHVPRSFGKRRQGTRADDHVSARADTDSILHREIRKKENASRAFERILTVGLENLQTVLSRHCCGLKCARRDPPANKANIISTRIVRRPSVVSVQSDDDDVGVPTEILGVRVVLETRRIPSAKGRRVRSLSE